MDIDDDCGRESSSGRKLNCSDNEEDVLSLYAQSDYDLDLSLEKGGGSSYKGSPRKVISPKKSKIIESRNRSPERRYERNRHHSGDHNRRRDRFKSDGNRFMRGSHLRNFRDANNAFTRGDNRAGISNTRSPMIQGLDSSSIYRKALALGVKPNFNAQKRGILGDAPMMQNLSMNQNHKLRFFDDSCSFTSNDRQNFFDDNLPWGFRRTGESRHSNIGFRGLGNQASILGEAGYQQQRILNRIRERNEEMRKESARRRTYHSSKRSRDDSFERNNEDHRRQDEKIIRDSSKTPPLKEGNESKEPETRIPKEPHKLPSQNIEERKQTSSAIGHEKEKPVKDVPVHNSKKIEIRLRNPPKPKVKPVVSSQNVSKPKGPDSHIPSSEESIPPIKKSRVNLPPSPVRKSVSQWVFGKKMELTDNTSATHSIDDSSKPITHVSIEVTSDKNAAVAPLSISSASGSLEQSDLSGVVDEPESQDFIERMVTPPIEVNYTIDAPPRPPNPGPIHLISSNSNSPAASRPSSRSGRGITSDQSRAVTPDVPPRPVNPPPPVSAPSPASTPEGMPPRPQNPGPPLDVSINSLSRSSSAASLTQSGNRFSNNSNSGGLLSLPSKSSHQNRVPVSQISNPSSHSTQQTLDMDISCVSRRKTLCNNPLISSSHAATLPFSHVSKEQGEQGNSGFPSRYDSAQTDAVDLSKSSSRTIPSEIVLGGNDLASDATLSKSSIQSTPSVTQCSNVSFSTIEMSRGYPGNRYLNSVSSKNVKTGLLPNPDATEESQEIKFSGQPSKPLIVESEITLKESIINCLKEKKFQQGLTALRNAMSKMPQKFGDGDVYEVIEFFGQHDAFEHVVSAARLVRNPDMRLLEFLLHVTEQSPDSQKGKEDDLWQIFNHVLGTDPPPTSVDVCIKCFAAIGNWDKVFTALRMYNSSLCLPNPTISICLQAAIDCEEEKHFRTVMMYLRYLSHRVKCNLDVNVLNNLWLFCVGKGLFEDLNKVDQVRNLVQQTSESESRLTTKISAILLEKIVGNKINSLLDFISIIGQQRCQQYLECFTAGFTIVENPGLKIEQFLRELKKAHGERKNEVFMASFCVVFLRFFCQKQSWTEAFELWQLTNELGIPCERAAVLENESQTSIALMCLEISVRHGSYDAAVSMLSESLVLGQPWDDTVQVRRRLCILQEIFYRSVDMRLDYAGIVFKALLSTKDTDQSIIPEYSRIVDMMTIYNNYVMGACHSGDLSILTTALELIRIANHKQLIVKPTVLRYLVVACVRFKLHTSAKEFLQRGMTVSIYPTIDVHSNMLLLPTDLATEEIAALLLLYLMLLKEYLVQAMQISKVGTEGNAGGVDVHQACSITVVPNNVHIRDHEFMQHYQLMSTEYGLLQRVQMILSSRGISSDNDSTFRYPIDYLKSPISSDFTYEGGRSVLKLNTTEVYNNVYYIEPPSD